MDRDVLSASYRLIAELFLHPALRDGARVERLLARVAAAPAEVRQPLDAFLASDAGCSEDEYVRTLELSPPVPLYLGAYLFDEPNSCRGAGMSGRNGYMLELASVYRHFGFDVDGGELPDFVPLMIEFLAISLEHEARDRIGLRRRFVEHHVSPGLPPFADALRKYESVYAKLVEALGATVSADVAAMGDLRAWTPPDAPRRGRGLPLIDTKEVRP